MEEIVPINKMDRDLDMLRMWILGASYEDCGKKYGLSRATVGAISQRDGWEKLKAELKQRKYNEVVNSFKDMTANVVLLLRTDLEKLLGETVKLNGKKKARKLTKDERQHARQFLEFLAHENRLEDGKPTEHTSGIVEHTLRLPPGVKHGFIIPPGKDVRVLPPKEEKEVINIQTLEKVLEFPPEDTDGKP